MDEEVAVRVSPFPKFQSYVQESPIEVPSLASELLSTRVITRPFIKAINLAIGV